MNNQIKQWTEASVKVIKELQKKYSINKGLFLTEGDLECILYKYLSEDKLFSENLDTQTNGWRSGFIHSQVTWFKPKKNSGFRVDLTICNPSNINIDTFEMVEEYPNKGFFHDGIALAIELKFIRDINPPKICEDAEMDYLKIVSELSIAKKILIEEGRYKNMTVNDVAYIILIVCKTSEIYDITCKHLTKTIDKKCPDNVFPIVFGHNNLLEINCNYNP